MSKIRFTFASLAIAALCGPLTAQAQQTLPGQTINPAQPQTQLGQPNTQSDRLQNNQGDRYEARRVSTDSQSNQQGPTVKEAIVNKLKKANEAEIELAKIAMEKTDNQELKQLAQTMVQDHQQFNQKLQQMSGKNQQGSQQNQDGQNQRTGQNQTAGQNQQRGQNQFASQNGRDSQSATVPKELCDIAEQACDNALKMTKEMLGNYDGQDFNMAFLGQQCVAHTMMLAELKAIESTGPEELQQIAQQGIQTTEKHLEKAKQLAKKLEDDSKNNRS